MSGDFPKYETLEMQEAFEYYYLLGPKRTLQAVAEKFGKGLRTVERWSACFHWKERVEQRDIEIGKRLERETIKETVEAIIGAKARYRALIKEAVDRWEEKLKARLIEIKDVKDLESLVKLDMLLIGEATERIETDLAAAIIAAYEGRKKHEGNAAGSG